MYQVIEAHGHHNTAHAWQDGTAPGVDLSGQVQVSMLADNAPRTLPRTGNVELGVVMMAQLVCDEAASRSLDLTCDATRAAESFPPNIEPSVITIVLER